jgi:hypothetical protein
MPELSRFFGIVIRMFYSDHDPAHFHAFYGEYEFADRDPHLAPLTRVPAKAGACFGSGMGEPS